MADAGLESWGLADSLRRISGVGYAEDAREGDGSACGFRAGKASAVQIAGRSRVSFQVRSPTRLGERERSTKSLLSRGVEWGLLASKVRRPLCCAERHGGGRRAAAAARVSCSKPAAAGSKSASRSGWGTRSHSPTSPSGEPVRKYGQIIGFASKAIPAGSLVHVNNLKADLFERDYAFATEMPVTGPAAERKTFRGYLRPDGRVGTRNYIAVISTVNCSASTSRYVADRFRDNLWRKDFPNVDGVFAITHKGGCGLPFEGPDHNILERVLAGFANHPERCGLRRRRASAARSAFAQHLVDAQDLVTLGPAKGNGQQRPGARPRMLNIQEEGGITRTVEAAARAVYELLPEANSWKRTEQPASKISLAMECGGSDGNSGVTANPALGVAADLLVAQGGTAFLGETTEIYGAEHLLTRRAVSREVGQKLVDRIKWWEWYTGIFGAQIDNNPSPGNKAGGLTTIYEKSLGALAKAGSSALVDVVPYAARVDGPGLDLHGYARL